MKKGSFGATLSWLAADGADEEQTDGVAATEAVRLLEQYSRNQKRFFMAVGLYRPHTPYVAPRKYFEMYPTKNINIPGVPENYFETIPEPARLSIRRRKDQVNLKPELAREAIRAYYASISFADAQVGRIVAALEDSGLAENTIVVFTSDHGYHMGEHGHYQKTTLFENATRVPFVIAGPGVTAAGHATAAPAEMVDFYPTLAALAGLQKPDYLSGVSLVPALTNPNARPRDSALTQYTDGYSIRTDQYRYTEWGPDGMKGRELYDHSSDPGELNNLADDSDYEATVRHHADLLKRRVLEAGVRPGRLRQIDPGKPRTFPQPGLPGTIRGNESNAR